MLRPTKPQRSRARRRRVPPSLWPAAGAKSERWQCAGAEQPHLLPTALVVDMWLAAPCATCATSPPTRAGTCASALLGRQAPRRLAHGPWWPPGCGGRAWWCI